MPHATVYEREVSTAFLTAQRIGLPTPEMGQAMPPTVIQRVEFGDDGALVSVTYDLPQGRQTNGPNQE